jgi:hypothetical protein
MNPVFTIEDCRTGEARQVGPDTMLATIGGPMFRALITGAENSQTKAFCVSTGTTFYKAQL